MARADALAAALALLERPRTAKLAKLPHLPKGMTFLLEIAAGDASALGEAHRLSGRSEETLQKAAGFFIEQVLLHPQGDSYRVLGGDCETSSRELRRNMALIMRWMHPDVVSNGSSENHLDRSLYTNRVNWAWESIKTEERRAAYNASLAAKESKPTRRPGSKPVTANDQKLRPIHTKPSRPKRRTKQLMIQRLETDGFWSRLLLFLGGRR